MKKTTTLSRSYLDIRLSGWTNQIGTVATDAALARRKHVQLPCFRGEKGIPGHPISVARSDGTCIVLLEVLEQVGGVLIEHRCPYVGRAEAPDNEDLPVHPISSVDPMVPLTIVVFPNYRKLLNQRNSLGKMTCGAFNNFVVHFLAPYMRILLICVTSIVDDFK